MKNAFKNEIFDNMNAESFKMISRLDKKMRNILKVRSSRVNNFNYYYYYLLLFIKA